MAATTHQQKQDEIDLEALLPEHDPNAKDAAGVEAPAPSSQPKDAGAQDKKTLSPYVIIPIWIALSSSVILYNKLIFTTLKFEYPIFLVTFHLTFATIGTRILRRFTHLLDDLNEINMTRETWTRRILPIGVLFSGSLIFSNMAYLYLSVSFVQMLKAFTPVSILIISFAFGLSAMDRKLFGIVFLISAGVCIASYGEASWDTRGFICQVLAIVLESSRLVMIQLILHGMKMGPLTSLYFFAPVCAVLNALVIPFTEGWAPFYALKDLGAFVLLSNASIAFALNVAAVFLIGAASSLILTLAGIGKDLLLIMGSVVFFGTPITGVQIIGYAIALGGLVLFKTQGQKK